ncbi:MAG: transposase [Arthrobacter sp.]
MSLNPIERSARDPRFVSCHVISDEAWVVLEPLFPKVKATVSPPMDRRTIVEATVWRFRTGARWRDAPERYRLDDPERKDQITQRRKRCGRPIDFGDRQRARYRGHNVIERRFNRLQQWRGLAMRSDKTARSYHGGLCLAATLHRLTKLPSLRCWSPPEVIRPSVNCGRPCPPHAEAGRSLTLIQSDV